MAHLSNRVGLLLLGLLAWTGCEAWRSSGPESDPGALLEADAGDAGTPSDPPEHCVTGGSGGPASDLRFQTFTDSRGVTSQYHVYAAGLSPGPVGLMLHMHGDGAGEFRNPQWHVDGFAAHGKRHNLITVSMLTPDAATTSWWRDGVNNALWVRELLEKLFAEHDIDRSRVMLVGYSGGANFVTQVLVPGYSELFCGGGSLVFGGGGAPASTNVKAFASDFVTGFKLHGYTGQDDTVGYNAVVHSDAGAAFYRDLGFFVTVEHPPGVNHFNIPFGEVVGARLDAGILR